MHTPKHKALAGIKSMLQGRMAEKLKPKMVVDIAVGKEAPHGEMQHGDIESPMEESQEMHGPGMENLSPEEQAQLHALYEKMGC